MFEVTLLISLFKVAFVVSATTEIDYNYPHLNSPPPWTEALEDDKFPELNSNLYQGDIFLRPGDKGKNALRQEEYLWPYGVVPFLFDANYTKNEISRVKAAMRRIESETCVHFIPYNGEQTYIKINKEAEGCFAMVGYRRGYEGQNIVNYESPACLKYRGTIEHEMLHVLGLFHEQSRPDRDDYVDIFWENIEKDLQSNFDKESAEVVTTFGIPYNYYSVMHYPRYAFSKNGKATILSKKNPKMKLGQRKEATFWDLEKIRRLYKCPNALTKKDGDIIDSDNEIESEKDSSYQKD